MRRFLLILSALVALALLCVIAIPTANAQDNTSPLLYLDVQHNGNLLVQKTLPYAFQSRSTAFTDRYIDTEFIDHVDQTSSVMETEPREGHAPAEQSAPRSVNYTLLEASIPNWQGEVSRVLNEKFLTQFRLIILFPGANSMPSTDVLHWPLRISVFGLVVLLFFARRISKSRWPVTHLPGVAGGISTLPGDLPAPVVSVLAERQIIPRTYLSILMDMLQKGNVTISGTYDENDWQRDLQSHVTFVRRFEPDQPWEKLVFDALPVHKTNSADLRVTLFGDEAIRVHLDQCLLDRGIFDEPPLQVMADHGQGCLAHLAWVSAAVILAIGVGLWVNLLFPWWVGAAVGIPAALGFLYWALDDTVGRVNPTPEGALEIRRWLAFGGSLRGGRVSPSQHPLQPDPLLPYAVALDSAAQWINDNNAVPPWFLPGGAREQTRHDLYMAYRGFIGADTWDLTGGPKIKSSRSSSSGGGGGG